MKQFERPRRIIEKTDDFREQAAAQDDRHGGLAEKKDAPAPFRLPEQNPEKTKNQKIRNVFGKKNACTVEKKILPAQPEYKIKKKKVHTFATKYEFLTKTKV